MPRIARHHFGAVAGTPDDELPRRMLQAADEVDLVRAPGDGFAQGIFTQFGITVDDEADGVRDGGFGSTTK